MSHDALLAGWADLEPGTGPGAPRATVAAGMAAIDGAAWRAARGAEAEGWAYLCACEGAPPPAMTLAAVRVAAAGRLMAAAPLFALSYRLDTPLQGGRLGALCAAVARWAPGLVEWRMLGVGSPFTDACPLAMDPRLDAAGRAAAVGALADAVEAEAARRRASLVAFKDLAPETEARVGADLAALGYVRIESLPAAVLDLAGAADLDAYLARLSRATRRDLKRKMKGAPRVAVEWRSTIAGLEAEIRALYDATRARSAVRYGDFEELPEGYFERVSAALPGDAVFACYRIDGTLAAFNLLLVEADRVIDKFLGMLYPLGPDHDLYALSWLENVRFCQRIGRRRLQSGQTAYAAKLRFGSRLEPRAHYVKHRNRLIHALVRRAAPLLAYPRWDPDLAQAPGEAAA